MRKRYKKNLSELDSASPAYWEEILGREGLSMNRGRNTSKLIYVGGAKDLEQVESAVLRDETSKVRPTGAKPE